MLYRLAPSGFVANAYLAATGSGTAKLDCYSQVGDAIAPTHYLVDSRGIVQLITQDFV